MSSLSLTVTRRKLSISLAVVVFVLAIFSVSRVALPKASRHKVSSLKASPSVVTPRSAAAAPAVTGQTRTINLNTGYDQWLATPSLISVGGQDNEWRVISDTINGAPQPPTANGRAANVVSDLIWSGYNPALPGYFPNSRWISIGPNHGAPLPPAPPAKKFQYAYYFTLPDGFSNPVLKMKLSSDDQIIKVTLNSAILFQGSGGSFVTPPLVLPASPLTSADFNSGPTVNVLTVEVEDTHAGLTGLVVDGTVTYQDCDRLPIRDLPKLTSITFWESSSASPTSPTFLVDAAQLTTKLSGTLSSANSDFAGVPGSELYDVFYSDWDGTPNPNGQFVTIEAVWPVGAPSGGGLNIGRVDFNGTGKSASSVASFVALGNNALPAEVGKAVDVDPNVLTDTTMGNTIGQTQRLRITVGFPCPCVAPPSGMVAWWPLDETAPATSLQDIIGGNNGTPFASPVGAAQGPQPVTGEVGGAMHFPKFGNGLSGVRVSPQAALANIGAAEFSIDAWVQVPPAPANRLHYIVNKFDPAQNRGYALYIVSPGVAGNERLEFKWGDGANVSTVQTISPLTTGQWHHVAVTLARNVGSFSLDIRLYVDGVQMGQQSGNPPGLGSLVNFVFLEIGWQPGTIDEPITIDELEIFNRALLLSEVQSIFNARSSGKCLTQPCPTITITPAVLVQQTWSTNLDYPALNLTATGGTGPYTFTVTGGTVPPGMVVDSDGTLHGKPVTPGTYNFTITATDANACRGSRDYRLIITSCPTVTINPATIPSGIAGTPYSQAFTATGGTAPYTFSVSGGSLPSGMTLSSAGTLLGTSTQSGSFTFSIKAIDANGCAGSRGYQISVIGCGSPSLGLFNTGLGDDGSPLAGGARDPHYALILPNGSIASAEALAQIPATHIPNSPTSRWIGPAPADLTTGAFTYRVKFTLTNCDPKRVIINGRWATDNRAVIRVNGVNTTSTTPNNGFGQLTPFTLNNTNATFAPGPNTLDFVVTNTGRVTGLRVEFAAALVAGPDLYMRDGLSDTGIEPNANTGNDPIYLSPDIWVRTEPLSGWNPYPYPITNPPLWIPALISQHQDPDYRSPLSGKPNYVYVRVRNRGDAASSGTELLQLYWASASTGLNWDPAKKGGSFIDNVQSNVLFGSEITKVRKNAATASMDERNAYVAALIKIATDPSLKFPNGNSYWHTQQEIHRYGPSYRHGSGNPTFVPSVAFLPWHREFMNRYEGLLQEADPKVKLLYWNWNNSPNSLMTNTFMGASGAGLAAGVSIGPPLSPATDPLYPNPYNASVTKVLRRRQPSNITELDNTVVGRSFYDDSNSAFNFSGGLESVSHNNSHGYIGGDWGVFFGDMTDIDTAARDPFFFLLHTKVDQLWARWQRKSLLNLDPTTTFSGVDLSTNANLQATMEPWNGAAFNPAGEIEPWTSTGMQSYAKPGFDESVTSPPFYDTAPLTIPALGPNEEVILEIPWYPPDPAKFGNITDPQHVCMIARIETSTSVPFGMSTGETADIAFNTLQNNNIAWRNVSVVDSFPGPFKRVRFLMRNVFHEPVTAELRLGAKLNQLGKEFFDLGTVAVDLGSDLLNRWRAGGAKGQGVELLPNGQLRVLRGDAVLEDIALKPDETFSVRLFFELRRDYQPTNRGEHIIFDVVQTGIPGNPKAIVGGQRYEVDVEKLTPVQPGRNWRFVPGLERLPEQWSGIDFDDSKWYQRKLDLGLLAPSSCGEGHGSVLGSTGHGTSPITTYLRHTFDVEDPEFFRSLLMRVKRADGAIVYLNGNEVYRANLPDGVVTERTFARKRTIGVEREVFFPVQLDPALLRRGSNVLAVEIHRAASSCDAPIFDLELNANWDSPGQVPYVQFANISKGELFTVGRTALIDVVALDADGSVRSVTFVVDGKPVQKLEKAPFRFHWRVKPGPHRMTAVVIDNSGLEGKAHTTVTGVSNVPPTVTLTQPPPQTVIARGNSLVVVANAADSDGTIRKVDFFLHDGTKFGDPPRLVGSVRRRPFIITLRDLQQPHNMITAVAHDSGGARTASIPVMVMVTGVASASHTGHSQH